MLGTFFLWSVFLLSCLSQGVVFLDHPSSSHVVVFSSSTKIIDFDGYLFDDYDNSYDYANFANSQEEESQEN